MEFKFQKYQGTGNDFVMIDCISQSSIDLSVDSIQKLCDRRFGIGADGLICIYDHDKYDFEMRYYNSDGSRSFCGNGARCAVAFAHTLGLFEKEASFLAVDGEHSAYLDGTSVRLKMADVNSISFDREAYVIETGSPHYISFIKALDDFDIVEFGKKVRYSDTYIKDGINVNLVQEIDGNALSMLTYERGVEDETLSCGTGATAVALAFAHKKKEKGYFEYDIKVKGGQLKVSGVPKDEGFTTIYLIGPAINVYNGSISI